MTRTYKRNKSGGYRLYQDGVYFYTTKSKAHAVRWMEAITLTESRGHEHEIATKVHRARVAQAHGIEWAMETWLECKTCGERLGPITCQVMTLGGLTGSWTRPERTPTP